MQKGVGTRLLACLCPVLLCTPPTLALALALIGVLYTYNNTIKQDAIYAIAFRHYTYQEKSD